MHPIVEQWIKDKRPVDKVTGIPHEVKAYIITKYAKDFNMDTLVETGTGFGAMIALVLDDFEEIHSIEMQPNFHAHSKERFKGQSKVHLYLGDSGEKIKEVLAKLTKPSLFFLDAHYAGPGTARGDLDTPIMAELEAILTAEHRHTVIIDDARLFGKDKDYPSTMAIATFVEEKGFSFGTEADELVIF